MAFSKILINFPASLFPVHFHLQTSLLKHATVVLPTLAADMETAGAKDLEKFDQAFFGHIGFVISNLTRSIWFGLTNGVFEACGSPSTRCYCRHLTRLSANFALITDYALLTLGGIFN